MQQFGMEFATRYSQPVPHACLPSARGAGWNNPPQTGGMKVKTHKKSSAALTSRGIEIQVMDPRKGNLGNLGVALVHAVRAGA